MNHQTVRAIQVCNSVVFKFAPVKIVMQKKMMKKVTVTQKKVVVLQQQQIHQQVKPM